MFLRHPLTHLDRWLVFFTKCPRDFNLLHMLPDYLIYASLITSSNQPVHLPTLWIYWAIVFSCILFSHLLLECCILFSCDLKWFLNNPLARKRGDPTLDLHNNHLINWNDWLELSMEYSFQNGEVRQLLPSTSLDGHPGQMILHPQPPPSGIRYGQTSLSNRQLFWHRQLCTSTRRHF